MRVAENRGRVSGEPWSRSLAKALQPATQPVALGGTRTPGVRLAEPIQPGVRRYQAEGKLRLRRAFVCSLLLLVLPAFVHAGAQQSVTFRQVVRQADAGLRWLVPPSVPFGIAVGEPQLTATARVQGAFTYVPAAGSMLDPGRHTLEVTFQPLDPNYRSDKASFAVTVRPPGKSSFRVRIASPLAGRNLIILSHANEVNLQLEISPVGDFHQPVTLACAPASGISCLFTPAIVRPDSKPETVALAIRWAEPPEPPPGSQARREPGQQAPDGIWRGRVLPRGASAVALLLLLPAAGVARRRRSKWLGRAVTLAVLSATLSMLGQCLGCGDPSQFESLTIKATSLVESRLIDATVVIQR